MVKVNITWFGHSMFLFENPQLRLLVDPFGAKMLCTASALAEMAAIFKTNM